ncbi:MAG TPA: hypothetical protein VLY20_01505 [Nitrospiria bacterium]|nr:hypothetical protein [Nitrospiria bacterium]
MKLQRIVLQDSAILQKLMLAQLGDFPGQIELLEENFNFETGSICIGIDKARRFVLLVPSLVENDAILLKALGQLSWLVRQHPLLVRIFSRPGAEFAPSPRAILVAPSFSATLREALAFIGIDIELYEYRAVELNQEQALLFDSVPIPDRKITAPIGSVAPRLQDPHSQVQLTDTERKFFEGFFPKSLPT